MRVKCLILRNFRNYGDLTWKPHPYLNIVSGDNAQGKTNLLEAVFFCTAGRSFRTTRERDMVNWDQDSSLARAQLEKGDTLVEISVSLNTNGGKYFLLNGKKQNRSSIFRPCLSVSFTPLDLDMIRGSPSERRKWIDLELGPYDSQYIYNLDKYERVLIQRNNLLKSYHGGRTKLAEMISPWNEQLFIYGSKIINSRINLLKNIFPHLKEIFSILTSGKEEFSFKYLSTLPLEKGIGPDDLKIIFEEMSKKKFPEEVIRQQTLVGPHRDDILFFINRSDARKFGSRGQQRSVVLALKLSLMKLFYSEYGEYPILIMDDVLHELDSQRRTGLDKLINGDGQVFITSNRLLGGLFTGRAGKYRVERGKIHEGED
ncbi:MAG: DNA replication/repair protein RecF [Bacillota bacterium]